MNKSVKWFIDRQSPSVDHKSVIFLDLLSFRFRTDEDMSVLREPDGSLDLHILKLWVVLFQ